MTATVQMTVETAIEILEDLKNNNSRDYHGWSDEQKENVSQAITHLKSSNYPGMSQHEGEFLSADTEALMARALFRMPEKNAKNEAIMYALLAADRGSVDGLIFMSHTYAMGQMGVIQQDAKKAFELAEKATKNSAPEALYLLADYHLRGIGTEKDIKEAAHLLLLSLEYDGPQPYSRSELVSIYRTLSKEITSSLETGDVLEFPKSNDSEVLDMPFNEVAEMVGEKQKLQRKITTAVFAYDNKHGIQFGGNKLDSH